MIMESILAKVEASQKKLSKLLTSNELQKLYGAKQASQLWETYRSQQRDIWKFFCDLSPSQRPQLKAWIDQKLEEI